MKITVSYKDIKLWTINWSKNTCNLIPRPTSLITIDHKFKYRNYPFFSVLDMSYKFIILKYMYMPLNTPILRWRGLCSQMNDFFYDNGQINNFPIFTHYVTLSALTQGKISELWARVTNIFRFTPLLYMCIVCCLYIAYYRCYLHVRRQSRYLTVIYL